MTELPNTEETKVSESHERLPTIEDVKIYWSTIHGIEKQEKYEENPDDEPVNYVYERCLKQMIINRIKAHREQIKKIENTYICEDCEFKTDSDKKASLHCSEKQHRLYRDLNKIPKLQERIEELIDIFKIEEADLQ